ncbi:MAG TPA: undecaprenyl-phosphate glucose phosphotransferase [Ferrovibrio sp.]|uniref:undecaprenyl-phosphate glucose phosphotransferase n=1 Tax=Ferrovibrio sp. TaxID=1917215 RepID=UPI002ED0D818
MTLEILAKPAVKARAHAAINAPQPRGPLARNAAYERASVERSGLALRNAGTASFPVVQTRRAAQAPATEPERLPGRISLIVVAGILRGFDAAVAFSAGFAATAFTPAGGADASAPLPLAISLFGALLVVNILHLLGSYHTRVVRSFSLSATHLLLAWGAAALAAGGVILLSHVPAGPERTWLASWLGYGAILSLLSRAVCALLMIRWRRQGRLQRRIAVLGSGAIGQRLLRRINAQADRNVVVVGVYDDRLARLPERCMGHKVLGTVADLIDRVRHGGIDMVIVALPLSAERRIAEIMAQLRQAAVDICLCPDQYGFQLSSNGLARGGDETWHVAGVNLLCAEQRPLRDWRGIAKNIEDRVVAAIILMLISPILAVIAVLVKLDSPGPVFFRQKRYGLNNQLIEVLKFRTMHNHASDPKAEQLTQRNDPRVTRLGAFLRRTSLDELPQFINVLRGEMSVVGPRPHALAAKAGGLLYQEAVRYYDARHRMKPGITGWAQVNGWRGETETVEQIEKRVEYDLYYIRNWSIWLDFLIIFRTIFGGFTGRQAY